MNEDPQEFTATQTVHLLTHTRDDHEHSFAEKKSLWKI